ncbi:MAG: hypothetical protein E7663_07670 [Ruminococcaceae bacterium]|nr:hypothetical protein [Oscillospiraceae bacterium]
MSLRFLHTGDLHLGSVLAAFSSRMAAKWREGQLAALESLFSRARAAGVQMILLAGDCFDTQEPDPALVRRFFALLGEQEVPVVITPGNHDPYRQGGFYDAVTLPPNVHLFRTGELAYFDFPLLRATVFGYAFTAETMAAPALPVASELPVDRIPILLAHGDTQSALSPYAPLSGGALKASGFAYAALGHIHKPVPQKYYGETLAAYCGFFAGRGFDEIGVGHANLVEIDGKSVHVTPVESTAARFEILSLDCTGALTGEDVRLGVERLLAEAAPEEGTALRVRLMGQVGAECHIEEGALERLGEGLALFEIRDETVPLFDADYLLKDPGMRGAFYRAMLPRLDSESERERAVAREALRLGFAALSGKEG